MRRRLNIFIDESGDFGFAKGSSELYAVSFVLHESSNSIKSELAYLNEKLDNLNYNGMVHLAYLVAKRGDYTNFELEQRKEIFWAIFYFAKRVKVKIHTVIIDKRYKNNKKQLSIALKGGINKFFRKIDDYMQDFKRVVIYYDNGQEILGNIIGNLLNTKDNIEHREDFNHKEKRLFQVSDMLTFIDKIIYKDKYNISLTKAEKYFFTVKEILGIVNQLKNKRI